MSARSLFPQPSKSQTNSCILFSIILQIFCILNSQSSAYKSKLGRHLSLRSLTSHRPLSSTIHTDLNKQHSLLACDICTAHLPKFQDIYGGGRISDSLDTQPSPGYIPTASKTAKDFANPNSSDDPKLQIQTISKL